MNKIRSDYFTGTLRIDDPQFVESVSKTLFLSFKRLKINPNYRDFFKNVIFLKYIVLDDPNVKVWQKKSAIRTTGLMGSQGNREMFLLIILLSIFPR
jgi:hypothetical protein